MTKKARLEEIVKLAQGVTIPLNMLRQLQPNYNPGNWISSHLESQNVGQGVNQRRFPVPQPANQLAFMAHGLGNMFTGGGLSKLVNPRMASTSPHLSSPSDVANYNKDYQNRLTEAGRLLSQSIEPAIMRARNKADAAGRPYNEVGIRGKANALMPMLAQGAGFLAPNSFLGRLVGNNPFTGAQFG